MKSKPTLRNFLLATLAASSLSLHAATIDLDLTSTNAGAILLAAGSNTFSFTGFSVDYLIVAGGGGGGGGIGTAGGGGGGGAGGLLEGQNLLIGGGQSIVVGTGGAGGTSGNQTGNTFAGTKGNNSTAFNLTAEGGGFGGRFDSGGGNGGSGGGAAARGNLTNANGGIGTAGQGFNGGTRTGTSTGASSGGGAGGAGINGGGNAIGRDGGAAVTRNITGANVVYAGGGGGGGDTGGGTSATGGNGGSGSGNGSNGATNTGGGGGGGGRSGGNGGAGGDGIVVVSYSGTQQLLAGGIVSTVGGNTIHQFTTTGTSTLALHSATVAGNITGSGNLIWDKTGTLTLTGTSDYDGSTTVNTGMLAILGSVTTSNLDFLNDGTINLGSTGQLFVLASNYSMLDADDDIAAGNISGDNPLFFSTFTVGSDDYVFFNAIPEPTTALLGGLGMLMLLRRRR